MTDQEAQWCCVWHSPNPPKPGILALRRAEIWWFPEHHGKWTIDRRTRDGEPDNVLVTVVTAHVTWLSLGTKWALDKLEVMVKDPLGGPDRVVPCSMAPAPFPPVQVPPLWVIETVRARLDELNGKKS